VSQLLKNSTHSIVDLVEGLRCVIKCIVLDPPCGEIVFITENIHLLILILVDRDGYLLSIKFDDQTKIRIKCK
jgi:hypothetical protein